MSSIRVALVGVRVAKEERSQRSQKICARESLGGSAAKGLIGIARSTWRKDTKTGSAGASRPCQLGNRSRHVEE